jgi:hypothetical protein
MTALVANNQRPAAELCTAGPEAAPTAYTQEQLQGMSDRDLDAAVAAKVFGRPAGTEPSSTSWSGFGRIAEHLRAHGYTLLANFYSTAHLAWMKHYPRKEEDRPAEVTVMDILDSGPLPQTWPQLQVGADTLPRAAAVAAVLVSQLEQRMATARVTPPAPAVSAGWTEERRRQKSEQMKRYWKRKRGDAA